MRSRSGLPAVAGAGCRVRVQHQDQNEDAAAHVASQRLELHRIRVGDLDHHQGAERQCRDDQQGQHPMKRHE